jgi:hypothetical protein
MTKIDRFDFLDAFPEEMQITALPEICWSKFLAGDFQRSWETAFKDFAEREAIERLIKNYSAELLKSILSAEVTKTIQSRYPGLYLHGKLGEISVFLAKGRVAPPSLTNDIREVADQLEELSAAEKATLISKASAHHYDKKGETVRRPIENFTDQFRHRVQESISNKMPFNDYIIHDIQGGNPARSKIVTGNLIPFAINNAAASISGVSKKEKNDLRPA